MSADFFVLDLEHTVRTVMKFLAEYVRFDNSIHRTERHGFFAEYIGIEIRMHRTKYHRLSAECVIFVLN